MNWDLATILVLLMTVSGVIWIYDTLFLAPKRAKTPEAEDNIPFLIDLARSLFPVFFIVLFLRSFLVEPFRIPSGSMMPTLLIGDFILVNKFSYGIRLPVANKKIIEIGEPERGDVVVFRYPEDPAIPFIKRVVGLPGDKITYNDTNKTLYINGKLIEQEVIGRYMGVGSGSGMTGREHRKENLTGVEHDILVKFEINPYSSFGRGEWVVPEKHYFVLGDNRDNSKDSRFWGFVPEENLIGKAFFIWMNWDLANGGVSAQRIGTQIK
jgi:signal peptidase I